MEIVDLSRNDSIATIARKCNQNFRQMAWSANQVMRKQTASQIVMPPVGSYLLTQSDPSSIYSGTTWQQSDTVTTDGNVVIPLWERTS